MDLFLIIILLGLFVLFTLGLNKRKFKGHFKNPFFEIKFESEN